MRTMIIIVGGLVLLAACIVVARLTGSNSATVGTAIKIFIAIWFVVATVNLWMGVTRAGYSFLEELPIFLLIFLLPVAAAVFVKWKFFP